MFTSIKTSRENKEVVTQLTRKLSLGPENVIARLALAYSISKERKLNLIDIKDSQGKEYNKKVLFGDHEEQYIAMICVHYNLYKTDKDIPKYVKLHIDDGLQLINEEISSESTISGMDFLVRKIENGLRGLNNSKYE
jgi:DNA sulfur modification protein DndE